MGKLFNCFVLSSLITLTLALIDGSGLTFTPILNMFVNPSSDIGSIFFSVLTSAIAAIGFSAFIIGTFVIKLDWLARAGLFTTFESYIVPPFVGLWNSLASKITNLPSGACLNNAAICSQLGSSNINVFGALIAALVAGPLILYAIYSGMEWIWGGDR